MNLQTSVKTIDKKINHDLKDLPNQLNAIKTSLNVGKTELVMYIAPKKQQGLELKIKLNGKKFYQDN